MTSVMALPWALEPSAFSDPAGQARVEADVEAPSEAEVPLPGWVVLVGSEPQAARLSVPRAKL